MNQNWEESARNFIRHEEENKKHTTPPQISCIVYWRDNSYIGSIQEIAPHYSKEIVLLSKTTNPVQLEFLKAIKKLDHSRLELGADDGLDLTGRQHILRKLENRLIQMTPEQTEYMIRNPFNIIEL